MSMGALRKTGKLLETPELVVIYKERQVRCLQMCVWFRAATTLYMCHLVFPCTVCNNNTCIIRVVTVRMGVKNGFFICSFLSPAWNFLCMVLLFSKNNFPHCLVCSTWVWKVIKVYGIYTNVLINWSAKSFFSWFLLYLGERIVLNF